MLGRRKKKQQTNKLSPHSTPLHSTPIPPHLLPKGKTGPMLSFPIEGWLAA